MNAYAAAIGVVVLGVSSSAFADPPLAAPGASLDPTAPPAEPVKTHSTALIGGGSTLVVLGGLSIIGGLAYTAAVVGEERGVAGFVFIGLPLILHGLGCIGGGIPMIVIGARKIPVTSRSRGLTLRPSVSAGPTSAALTWTW